MPGSIAFTVRSLSAHRAVEKLARAGVAVRACRPLQKNAVDLKIRAKDAKKSFAILRGSCYNIENIRYCGSARLLREAVRAAGLLLGALFFLFAVRFAEGRVLAVEFTGSGAYYQREIEAMLREEGVGPFSPMPADTARLTARVLSLPRVEFCAFKKRGGVLTVEVQCTDGVEPIAGMPLTSNVSGVVETLVVIRGTPLVEEGAAVEKGDLLVGDYLLVGEEKLPALVIAKAVIRRDISVEYELGEAQAIAQALLDFGELAELHTGKTEKGWRVEGVARTTVSLNLGEEN